MVSDGNTMYLQGTPKYFTEYLQSPKKKKKNLDNIMELYEATKKCQIFHC